MTLPSAPVLWVLSGGVALLLMASFLVRRAQPGSELLLRVRSWWLMVAVFGTALFLPRPALIVLLAFISFLALKEYLSLIPTRRADRRVLFWAYLAIPLQYLFVYYENYGMFIIFVPVYVFLFLPLVMVFVGETKRFLTAVGTLHWGLMLTVFCLAHLAFLVVLPPAGEGPELLLFIVLLTQLNDVSQYLWGKRFGRRKVVPSISPNKTLEGLVGGVLTTTLLALLLGPLLTPLSWWMALWVGCLLGLVGFVGDVLLSAVKRDLGVKDSSALIPGHGGILDRIDSLTYTAPLFFHIIRFFYYLPS